MSEWKPPADAKPVSGWTPPKDAVVVDPKPQAPTPSTAPPGVVAEPTGVDGGPGAPMQASVPQPAPSQGAFTPQAVSESIDVQLGSSVRPKGLLTPEQRMSYAKELQDLNTSSTKYTQGRGGDGPTIIPYKDAGAVRQMKTIERVLQEDAAIDPEGNAQALGLYQQVEAEKKHLKNPSLMMRSEEGKARLRQIADAADEVAPEPLTFLQYRNVEFPAPEQGSMIDVRLTDPRRDKLIRDFEEIAPVIGDRKTQMELKERQERTDEGAVSREQDINYWMDVLQFQGRRLAGRELRLQEQRANGVPEESLIEEAQDIQAGREYVRQQMLEQAKRDPRSFEDKMNQVQQVVADALPQSAGEAATKRFFASGADTYRRALAGATRLASFGEGYDAADKVSDWAADISKNRDSQISKKNKGTLIDDIAAGAGTMVALIGASGAGTAGLAPVVATSLATEYEGYVRQAMDAGLDQKTAETAGLPYALLAAGIETLNPQTFLANKAGMTALRAKFIDLVKNGTDPKSAMKMALEVAEPAIKESAEELSQNLTELGTNYSVNMLTGAQLNDELPTMKEVGRTVLVSSLLGGMAQLPSTLGSRGTKQERTRLQAEAMQKAAANPKDVDEIVQMLPEVDRDPFRERLEALSKTYKGNELLEMDPVKAADVADIVERKNAVEQQIREAPMDPVLEAAKGDPRKREAAALTTDMIEALGIPANKAKAALASSGLEQMPEGTKAITNPDGSVTLEKKPEAGEKKKSKAVESVMTETATEETTGAPTGVPEGVGAVTPEAPLEPTPDEGATAITETPTEATTDPGAAPGLQVDTPAPETTIADGEVIPQGPPDVPQDVQQDAPIEPQQVKKTLTTKRAYEGAFREGVKAELEKLGLNREVETYAQARSNAKALIDAVGIEAALDAVRNNDVPGGAAAYIWNAAIENIDRRAAIESDPEVRQRLDAEVASLINEAGSQQLSSGRFNSAWGDIYETSDLGYNSEVKANEWRRQFGEEPSPELMAKWRERDKEFEELRIKLAEAQKRAEEAEEKATIKAIKEATAREKTRDRKRTYTEKSKALADQFRKLKAKPMTFRDADGNQIEVKQMGFDWNALVEIGAKAIEKTGEIADGIAAIAEKLKESSFFNSMDDRNKQAILQQIEDAFRAANEEDVDVGRIRVPKKMIRDAVEAGANDIASLVAVIKEQLSDVYPNATDREIRDAITEYGKVVSMSKDEIAADIRRIKRIGRITSALEDVQNKKRPLRSGLQRDKMGAEERALNKQLRDALKELPIDAEAEARELRTALDAAKTRTRNRIEDLQREIEMREKLPRNTRTIQPDAELAALIEERDALQKVHDEVFNDPETAAEERLARAIDAARRAVENYEKRIRDKNLDPKKPAPVKETTELKTIRQQLAAAKAEYQKLQEEAGVIEKRKLETAKKVATQRIQDLERRIKEGDFSRNVSKPVIKDDELTKLLAQKVRLKEEYGKEFFKHKLANRSMPEKWKDAMWEAWGLTRALQATAELSFVLMQGGAMTISNLWRKPQATAQAFRNMAKAFASQSKSEEWLRKIKAQEWYPIAKEAKLAITEPSGEMSAREELFLSDWARLIWDTIGRPFKLKSEAAYNRWKAANPLKALERASVAYLDTLRVERFLDGLDILEKNKQAGEEVTKQDYKDIADAINTLTGRASIGKAESIASGLAKLVFSIRLWASTIKTATPYALIHFGKMTPTARKMAVQDMGRFIGTTMGVVAMAAAYLNNDDDEETGVEMDPRSSDFGKIKIGNTRIDPWGGRIQQVVFSTKLAIGAMSLVTDKPLNAHKDPKTGKTYPLGVPYKSPNMMEVVTRMATNKLAPSASLVADAMNTRVDSKGKRKDAYGRDFDLQDRVAEKFMPIYFGTIEDLTKEDPGALEGFLLFYAFFGGGVQTYESKTNKTSGPTAAERLEAMRESR